MVIKKYPSSEEKTTDSPPQISNGKLLIISTYMFSMFVDDSQDKFGKLEVGGQLMGMLL